MDSIIYITLEQAQDIHAKTIKYSGGGTYEHFDLGRLDSVLQNIQNDIYYPTFVDKLTHLFYCTCEFHCFADGNKRLAITLCAQFLLFNGYMGVAKNFFVITENISYQVAAGKIKKELLHRIMTAIMDDTYNYDEELKLDILNAIS
ncbi:type II toxin-antitoxin system death-on-curing family toxin [Proteiniclasticum sp. QWL-01]|uniref:type II toxin-antitoxin system death-on-curing family toxin n=1 Tax=Proteiniclasticum sp. QWL-01 TaxID=3036945 RepID=UPI00241146C3|nr:type II toxin-antitoxin system death-on-curing family toxin [Proteiniclasticum sp. QWL-01]WFF73669.1 type II toxin-antitoxin system death-on-curing family toxin [Proteiniclasticum sp. QWL-01]